jgi:hypothetical protein
MDGLEWPCDKEHSSLSKTYQVECWSFIIKKITKVGTKHLDEGNIQPHIRSLNPLVMPYGKQDPTL